MITDINSADTYRFILHTMGAFRIQIFDVKGGEIKYAVGQEATLSEPAWQPEGLGAAELEVRGTDGSFRMNTWYYLKVTASQTEDLQLLLVQPPSVDFIAGFLKSHQTSQTFIQKFQYQTNREQVKLLVFDAPTPPSIGLKTVGNAYYQVKIVIEALKPHFYPVVYTRKVESDTEPTDGLGGLGYPNINDYDRAFGENPFKQLQQHRFEYTFRDFSSKEYAY